MPVPTEAQTEGVISFAPACSIDTVEAGGSQPEKGGLRIRQALPEDLEDVLGLYGQLDLNKREVLPPAVAAEWRLA
ncbi:Hypothetical protein DEACI_2016 [Acididesulfobacillus acetoxydans]|uniref:Uncharacterized protein n=1 Tax=Acididesulfobacillus acetoxydans TaxID=1561005 RepID=A0A8S0X544_9FIRM|nr:hypothetical protein [Acididesulfobacillus acetoxydans]CAA7601350.1 Hypothetical protein DEACI_2016 [Acididesulfobacillus acetoxydans]CEJ07177.1 Hypothetical protein DEACI_1635 [Acididesulfobacillus acetoxydans]